MATPTKYQQPRDQGPHKGRENRRHASSRACFPKVSELGRFGARQTAATPTKTKFLRDEHYFSLSRSPHQPKTTNDKTNPGAKRRPAGKVRAALPWRLSCYTCRVSVEAFMLCTAPPDPDTCRVTVEALTLCTAPPDPGTCRVTLEAFMLHMHSTTRPGHMYIHHSFSP